MSLAKKVVFVTGAGRGQGRNHALRIAEAGGNLALLDIGAATLENPKYPTASSDDLRETERLVRERGAECITFEVDVRDYDGLAESARSTFDHYGQIDGVVANAGIADTFLPVWEIPNENWDTVLSINLTGVFYTCKATIPYVRRGGRGGSIVLISSVAGIKAVPYFGHYTASKFGVRGLSLVLANELGPEGIRCNSVHPGAVDTPMQNAMSDLSGVPYEDLMNQYRVVQTIPEIIQPDDTSAAVVWLLSDESRYVNGLELLVDAGETKK
jgi:NAD(P)-dependent dehydrogenase (short-subunit alcohol dehydrogenase family)